MNITKDLKPLPSAPSPVGSNNQQKDTRDFALDWNINKNIKPVNESVPQTNTSKNNGS